MPQRYPAQGDNPREDEVLAEITKIIRGPEVGLVAKWLTILIEEAKESLVMADPEAIPRLQGQAQAYKKMLRRLERMKHAK